MKLRKLNRAVHRDLGYFFFGMTIIYAISGVALNHRHEWNPNYIIQQEEFTVNVPEDPSEIDENYVMAFLEVVEEERNYKTHLVAGENLRIFIEGGSVEVNITSGEANMETIRKRPFFNQINFLHYNTPRKLWTWFSDAYAAGLFLLAVSGLFILKGKNGIKGRGAWLTGAGIIIPLIFLFFYF